MASTFPPDNWVAAALACASVLCLPLTAAAQAHVRPLGDTSARERHSIAAVRVDQTPKIDGVLDESVWQKAPVIDEFTQQEPREGATATERTEVRVMYDSRSLLIGVHAYDAQPSAIVATEMRRDADRLFDEDNFQIILDTFNDSRNGYMFVTTPLGAKLEQQISEEGEGNIRAGLLNANVNRTEDSLRRNSDRAASHVLHAPDVRRRGVAARVREANGVNTSPVLGWLVFTRFVTRTDQPLRGGRRTSALTDSQSLNPRNPRMIFFVTCSLRCKFTRASRQRRCCR